MDKRQRFIEFEEHLLNDDKPSSYFRNLADAGSLTDYPFTLLGDLQNVKQPPQFHPEGSVWEHTMLVVDLAAAVRHISRNPQVFMWAALLHDLGKATTTRVRRGKITAYDHDKHGARLAADFLEELTDDEKFIVQVSQMVRWHMQILYVIKNLPFADIDQMQNEVPLREITLLAMCDRLGRGNMNKKTQEAELANLESFLQRCQPEGEYIFYPRPEFPDDLFHNV